MRKNEAGQTIELLVIDTNSNLPKTAAAASLTFYVSVDNSAPAALAAASIAEVNATNSKGLYRSALSAAETNGNKLIFSGVSGLAGVEVVPQVIYTDLQDQLARIEAAAGQIRGTPLSWAGNVGPGGELQLTLGDDHETVIANSVPIAVKDPGGLLYARLTAGGVTLQWAAGQNKTAALITGTVTAVAFDGGTSVTTVTVEVPNCAALGDTMAPYTWQLQRTLGGRRKRELTGTLKLRQDMIGA